MTSVHNRSGIIRMMLVAVAALVLGACQGPDQGTTGGRIDPYRSTASDVGSTAASLPSLLEFCDQTAQQLTQDLNSIPEIQQAQDRQILELGDLYNKTRTSTNDFELIQRRLRGQLMQSPVVRQKFRIVEGRARMNREVARVEAEGADVGSTAQYDPAKTYVLQGDFLEAVRGGRRQYYFEFKLTNLDTRDIVFAKSYDLAQGG